MDFEIILACDKNYGIAIATATATITATATATATTNNSINNNNNSDNALKEHYNYTAGTLPWYIAEDSSFFKNTTSYIPNELKVNNMDLKNAIIMGRATADTFKRPLPNRLNVVITKTNYRANEGFITYSSLDNALNALN